MVLAVTTVSGVLIGAGTTSLGIALGAVLERWRDATVWKREQSVRWASDLRLAHRELLAKADSYWRQSVTFISTMQSQTPNEPMGDEYTKRFLGDVQGMISRDHDLQAAKADVDMIASQAEREAAQEYVDAVLELMLGNEEQGDEIVAAYWTARLKYVDAIRAALTASD